jgi:hypothetical protein
VLLGFTVDVAEVEIIPTSAHSLADVILIDGVVDDDTTLQATAPHLRDITRPGRQGDLVDMQYLAQAARPGPASKVLCVLLPQQT